MNGKLSTTKAAIESCLNEIAVLFKDPKITLVVRAPGFDGADIIMTSDDLDKVIESIRALKDRQVGCNP